MIENDIMIETVKTDDQKILDRLEAYNRFFSIINERGITPYKVSKDTGISTATLSDWKKGKSMPKRDKLEKISDYLKVDFEYLALGRKNSDSNLRENALLDAKIIKDVRLREAIKKYYELDDLCKNHVLELIELLSKDGRNNELDS